MAHFVVSLARGLLLAAVALSAIVSMYEATNAVAVQSNHSVFVSGLIMIFTAALLNPLFCFIANYGLMRYENVSPGLALTLTLPACIAWCIAAGRSLFAMMAR